MTIVAIDLVDSATGELTANGHKFTRIATIENPVEQSGRADNSARIYEAMHDTGVPEIGDAHPNVANSLLTKIRCVALEPNYLKLELIYETTQPNYQIITLGQSDISMESSLIQIETTKKFGTGSELPITPLNYIYPIGALNPAEPFKEDPNDPTKRIANLLTAAFSEDDEIPVANLYVPARIYTIRKRLLGTDEDELELLNDNYQGHVNDSTWRTYAARTWLCVGITWRTTDRRTTYNIDVRFQFKFDTFDAEFVYHNSFTGKVPDDVFTQAPNSFRRDRIQREADFDQLLTDIGE